MKIFTICIRIFSGLMFISIFALLYGCTEPDTLSEKDFVGQWKSSRSETPVFLNANGEWEIINDKNSILQFGVWKYRNRKIIWSYKQGNQFLHDVNPVSSYSPQEFKVREKDGAVTTFIKLE